MQKESQDGAQTSPNMLLLRSVAAPLGTIPMGSHGHVYDTLDASRSNSGLREGTVSRLDIPLQSLQASKKKCPCESQTSLMGSALVCHRRFQMAFISISKEWV